MKIKNLRGECQHCGGPIEFHAEHVGTTANCPHCDQPTELLLAQPPEEGSPVRTKAIMFTVIVAVILIGGVVGASVALKRAKRLRAEQAQTKTETAEPTAPFDPFARNGFRVSPVTFGKGLGRSSNSSMVFAQGSIVNTTNRQRFGVKVELELFDAAGAKIGVATDYQSVMEAGAEWSYHALVIEKKVVSAKVAAVNESAR
jgi:hypothetical protein